MSETMTLVLVLASSVLAVALVIGLNVLLGGWKPVRLESADTAGRALADYVLGFTPSKDSVIDADAKAALVLEEGGERLGLVLASADRPVVRALAPGDVRKAEAEGSRLVLTLDDFTLPRATLTFSTKDEAQRWAQIAERYMQTRRKAARHA